MTQDARAGYVAEYNSLRELLNAGCKLSNQQQARKRLLAMMLGAIPRCGDREGAAFGRNNFAGPGWRDIAGARPTDLFDLASKLHDFMYEANGIKIAKLARDPREQSRKSKADYIFRVMIAEAGVIDELDDLYLAAGARMIFHGRNRSQFRRDDGFVNIIHHPELSVDHGHLIVPLSQLPGEEARAIRTPRMGIWPTAHDYSATTDFDNEHKDWRSWARVRFIGCWDRVSSVSERDGLSAAMRGELRQRKRVGPERQHH